MTLSAACAYGRLSVGLRDACAVVAAPSSMPGEVYRELSGSGAILCSVQIPAVLNTVGVGFALACGSRSLRLMLDMVPCLCKKTGPL